MCKAKIETLNQKVSFPIVWDLKGSSAGRANGLHDHGQKAGAFRVARG